MHAHFNVFPLPHWPHPSHRGHTTVHDTHSPTQPTALTITHQSWTHFWVLLQLMMFWPWCIWDLHVRSNGYGAEDVRWLAPLAMLAMSQQVIFVTFVQLHTAVVTNLSRGLPSTSSHEACGHVASAHASFDDVSLSDARRWGNITYFVSANPPPKADISTFHLNMQLNR